MNSETQELVQQYINETLKDVNGISSSAYEILKYLMKVDRHFASSLHETYGQCIEAGNRYFVPADDFLN
jgi:hypothetical protein